MTKVIMIIMWMMSTTIIGCQRITVGQSHNSGDTVAKILVISWEW
jgi:hypothetical protein